MENNKNPKYQTIIEKLLMVFQKENSAGIRVGSNFETNVDLTVLTQKMDGFSDESVAEKASLFSTTFTYSYDERFEKYLRQYPSAQEINFIEDELKLINQILDILDKEKSDEKNVFFIFRQHKDFLEKTAKDTEARKEINLGLIKLMSLLFITTRTNVLGFFLLLKDAGVLKFKTDYEMVQWIEQVCMYNKDKEMKKLMIELNKLRNSKKNTEAIEQFWKAIFCNTKIITKFD